MRAYKEYKDSGYDWLGKIPAHWRCVKIREIFIERRNKVSDKDFPPLSVTKAGIVPQLETAAKSDDGDNRKRVNVGDFVINGRSDRKGCSGISPLEGSVSLINHVLSPRLGVNKAFLHYLLRSNFFIEEFYKNGRGIVADLWTTRYSDMKTIRLPLPPREEQDAIVRFLDAKCAKIDSLIKLKERQIALLNEKKQNIINQAVTRGLDPNAPMKDSGVDWIGEIPEGWEVKRLLTLAKFQNGISEAGDFFSSGFPFITYGDVYNNYELPHEAGGVAKANLKQQEVYSVKRGDIFLTRTSETIKEIGFSSVSIRDMAQAVFSGFLIRVRPQEGMLLPEYSKYFFRSTVVREYFSSAMNIVIRASLGQSLLKNLPVILPPLDQQAQIATHLDTSNQSIVTCIQSIKSSIFFLKEYKQKLISDVVTGKINMLTA